MTELFISLFTFLLFIVRIYLIAVSPIQDIYFYSLWSPTSNSLTYTTTNFNRTKGFPNFYKVNSFLYKSLVRRLISSDLVSVFNYYPTSVSGG